MKVCITCREKFDKTIGACPSCNYIPEMIDGYCAFAPGLAKENKNFRPSYFEKLASLEEGNFWFRYRNCLIIYYLWEYFPAAKNFLEIGCGTGFVLSAIEKAFPYLSLSGSEIYSIGLSYAANRLKNVHLFQMDACCIPFENEFDVIGAFDVLEHIKEDSLVLSQMYQAVNKGGGIIITVPQHPFLWSSTDEHACHVRRYNKLDLRQQVEKAGFKVLRITSFISFLFPLMIFSRLRKTSSKDRDGVIEELIMGKYSNDFLEKICNFEQLFIQAGINFPFGGSLLLIGRKV